MNICARIFLCHQGIRFWNLCEAFSNNLEYVLYWCLTLEKNCRLKLYMRGKILLFWIITPNTYFFVFFNIRLAILTFDAMSTMPSFNYHAPLDIIQGFSDDRTTKAKLSVHDAADHLFVLYLRGVSSSWKQPIGCIALKNSPNTDALHDIVFEALSAAHTQGNFE